MQVNMGLHISKGLQGLSKKKEKSKGMQVNMGLNISMGLQVYI
jgi:hypothetical protein